MNISDKINSGLHYLSLVLGGIVGMSVNEIITLLMGVIGIATFFVNWNHKKKALHIQQQQLELNQQKAKSDGYDINTKN